MALRLNNEFYTIIGVLPPWLHWLDSRNTECGDRLGATNHCLDVYAPLTAESSMPGSSSRSNRYLTVFGRLKAGATLGQGREDMRVLSARLEKQYPDTNRGWSTEVERLDRSFRGINRQDVILQTTVAFVLLIACANVANLLLVRANARRREIAMRCALGAGRGRVAWQLLTEGLLLASLAGALGLCLALWGTRLLLNMTQLDLIGSAMDWRTVAFTAAATLVTALMFSLAPVMMASKMDILGSLKGGSRSSGRGRSGLRLQRALVATEMGLALVLSIAAGLLATSFHKLTRVDLGFGTRHLLLVRIVGPPKTASHSDKSERSAFLKRYLELAETQSGIESAALVTWPQLWGGDAVHVRKGAGRGAAADELQVTYRAATASYFRTLGVRILKGRDFSRSDLGSHVAIINETMARRLWNSSEGPLGQYVTIDGVFSLSVIGIVPAMADDDFTDLTRPQIVELTAAPENNPWLVTRTVGDPLATVAGLQKAMLLANKDQPLAAVQTMEDVLDRTLGDSRVNMELLFAFAVMAVLLAAMGIYGVMSYFLAQRTQELGVRIALGATSRDVYRLVLSDSLRLALGGVGLGLFASYWTARVLSSLLYGVSPTDVPSFAGASLILLTVALAASYVPARRATRVDPNVALRCD